MSRIFPITKRILAAFWVWACFSSPSVGADSPDSPQPSSYLEALAPVVDEVGVLSASEVAALKQTLLAIDTQYQVRAGIVVLRSTEPEGIEKHANTLGNDWRIGTRNGMLIVLAVQDRTARIEVSRGLEGVVPDAYARWVIQESMAPAFARGQYFNGLNASLAQLSARLGGEPINFKTDRQDKVSPLSAKKWQQFFVAQALLLGFGWFFFFVAGIVGDLRRWWSAIYLLVVGGGEFALSHFVLGVSQEVAVAVGAVSGVAAAIFVWQRASAVEERVSREAPALAEQNRRWEERMKKFAKKHPRRTTDAASLTSGLSSVADSSSDTSSSSSDNRSDDFAGGGATGRW